MLAGRGAGRARLHLLLCWSPSDWDAGWLVAVRRCYATTLTVHRQRRRQARPLQDLDGQAFARRV